MYTDLWIILPNKYPPRKKGDPHPESKLENRGKKGRPFAMENLGLCHAFDTAATSEVCPRPAKTRGLCEQHYIKVRKLLKVGYTPEQIVELGLLHYQIRSASKFTPTGGRCAGFGELKGVCDRPAEARGMCRRCYQRWYAPKKKARYAELGRPMALGDDAETGVDEVWEE